MGPSFLDPQKTKDGRPFGPIRYKQLIKELYVIAKTIHTPYTELLEITPTEKNELINLILEENKKSEEAMEKIRAKNRSRKNGPRGL